MARSIRIEFAGANYHVMARGNRRESIFADDEDRCLFLQTLGEACGMTGWRVHAWVLMGNHYHLLIETPEPNLVAGMKWLQNAYTRRFNTRHREWGRLFGDRYKSVLVEGDGCYYESLLDYIHLNPVRARMVDVQNGHSVGEYPWSSVAEGYLLRPGKRPWWLAAKEGLSAFDCPDTAKGRRQWLGRLDRRAMAEDRERCGLPDVLNGRDKRMSDLRRGWYWGSEAFAEKMLQIGEGVLKKNRHRDSGGAQEGRAHGEREAIRILKEGLQVLDLERSKLIKYPGSWPPKVAIAQAIWKNTTVDMKWISTQLGMSSPANVSQQIRRHAEKSKDLPKALLKWLKQMKNVA